MEKAKLSLLARYGIAILTVSLAVLITLYLHRVVGFTLNIAPLAIAALIISAWVGGFWQGLLAVLLLHLSIDYYFESRPNPPHTLEIRNEDVVRIMVMMVVVLLTSWRRRAQRKLNERAQQQLAVADLGQKALAGADLQSLIEEAAAIAAKHLKVDYSVLCELLPDGNTLEVKAGVGWKENLVGRTAILMDKTARADRLLRSAEPMVISDHSKEDDFSYELPLRNHRIASSLSVIINGKEMPYGVLSALTQRRRKFTSDDIAFLQAIANILAEAICRKRSEEEREQLLAREQAARAQAEEANRLKDEFLATISHELRTPLNHMLGWVMMLRSGSLQAEKSAEALETIERNVRAQNRLVEDLLDVSRTVTGRMQLHIQPVAPAQLVEAALASVRPAAEAKGVRLQVALDSRPGTISGDPDRLQQVIWNLVSNAIKFTPKGGRVQARIERLNSHVEIKVSDTGEGIAPEFLPHVFDRFSQADGSSKRRYGGLGLGLAIVRHLVELHGGSVRVESPGLGQGATFTVVLPLTIVHSLPEQTRPQEVLDSNSLKRDGVPRLDGTRVLIVDDEDDARALLITILSANGAEVKAASGRAEALEAVEEWRPDVLVSDIGMPNGDGYELIREIRRTDSMAGRQLPAVALTAYARADDRMRALAAGFQMHVTKPVEPRELLVVVASLAGRLR
jgi:signal transduction histidine kinase